MIFEASWRQTPEHQHAINHVFVIIRANGALRAHGARGADLLTGLEGWGCADAAGPSCAAVRRRWATRCELFDLTTHRCMSLEIFESGARWSAQTLAFRAVFDVPNQVFRCPQPGRYIFPR